VGNADSVAVVGSATGLLGVGAVLPGEVDEVVGPTEDALAVEVEAVVTVDGDELQPATARTAHTRVTRSRLIGHGADHPTPLSNSLHRRPRGMRRWPGKL
jgi:hypothetical protein